MTPPLSARAPTDIQFVPHHNLLAYRMTALEDRERMDLWLYDIETQEHTLWLRANDVVGETHKDASQLSAA